MSLFFVFFCFKLQIKFETMGTLILITLLTIAALLALLLIAVAVLINKGKERK